MADARDRRRQAPALFTDLYELTMMRSYHAESMDGEAVFELFFRKLPARRNFAVAAGLGDVLEYLRNVRFSEDDLEYLARKRMPEDFLERLREFRFSGEVHAMPEGTVFFPNEPVAQVVAPLDEAQVVETLVLNQIHFQTVLTSKAARVVLAAQGRDVVDFGSRRAHGTDAALKAARCAYLAGASGTSNVLAGKIYGLPVFGTMAHSYIQAHDDELAAFEAFAAINPGTTLLVDTYDTISGVERVVAMAQEQGAAFDVRAIRLDSGDLSDLAKQARGMLDQAGLGGVRIFASSGLDEEAIAKLLDAGAPIDGFGVGTKMTVSTDAPDLDMAYKLVAYDGEPRMKLSSAKVIHPGRKQVWREMRQGVALRDHLGLHDEELPGTPLLEPVLRGGKRLPGATSDLEAARKRCREQVAALPEALRALEPAREPYEVQTSRKLRTTMENLRAELIEEQC